MVERKGSVIAKVVPNCQTKTIFPLINKTVEKDTMIYTDEFTTYQNLKHQGYGHQKVHHSARAWVIGNAHTNSIEGFWSLLKGGLRGVYKGRAERKYLQNYVNEFAFRYNRRFDEVPMFLSFLGAVQKSSD